ncbi:hypothetical protein BDQ17DRAFT_1356811 [Cyathus striatus]|nr:hypothetical protein BDQ17DRAFT_1356811 [Cyathus striatus]
MANNSNTAQVDTTSHRPGELRAEIPHVIDNFVGQEIYLEDLKKFFGIIESNDPIKRIRRKTNVLYGLGGIGKTQIVLKFIDETRSHWTHVFWTDAASEDTVEQGLKEIYNTNIAGSANAPPFSIASVLTWISELEHGWLMILDNAEQPMEVVEKYLPPRDKGSVVITTRNPALKAITYREYSMEITTLSEDASVTLLLKTIGLDPNAPHYKRMATEIVAKVHHLPLAIHQVGSYIGSGKCSIYNFNEVFDEDRSQILDDEAFKGASNYGRTVYGTWEALFQKLVDIANYDVDEDTAAAARHAMRIINMCAFFYHEKIPEDMFKRAAKYYQQNFESLSIEGLPILLRTLNSELFCLNQNGEWNEQLFKKCIDILSSLSLIKVNDKKYSLHPLVQSWCQDRLSENDQQKWVLNSRGVIVASNSDEDTMDEYIYKQSIAPHIIQNLDEGKRVNTTTYYDDVNQVFASILKGNGNYALAEELRLETVNMRRQLLGAENPATITSMVNLASVYLNTTKWAEAEKLQTQVMQRSAQILGPEHLDTLRNMADLASTYMYQGKWSEAEKLQLQVLEIRTKIYGPEHHYILSISANLAMTYSNQGKLAEAEKIQLEVVEKSTKSLGPEDLDTVKHMSNLAKIFYKLGKLNEAENMQEELIEIRTRLLGDEHPDTITSVGDIAATYIDKGYVPEAESLQRQVVEMRTATLGEEHPYTLNGMTTLASTCKIQGKLAEAEEIEIHVLNLSTKILGEDHPDTLKVKENLSVTYGKQGKWKDAEELQKQVVQARKEIFGDDHPDTMSSMVILMETLKIQGKWEQK